ncbi:MAG TPA: NAD(P)-dependent oxidoreductase, partial [Bradyrhizobium sp.]|nr:NAD(P)-dependent oxidoreductase [Bradyrhizobium sp.]
MADQSPKSPYSRREVVGAGAALAASSITPASANTGEGKSGQPLLNPNDKYPSPPFKKQSQPWPGLASQMDPPPDHGEQTYRGSERLAGRKALITGGDSGMGR